jgi:hypothetical protein
MPDVKNFTRWKFGSPAAKDRIIIGLMNRVEELERDKAERDARKGMPDELKRMGIRTVKPKIIS